jgi:transcriptional regulator with XRE-family HTH domain
MLTVREAAGVVRELREERQWSQTELARIAGVSRSFIVDLEGAKPTIEASKLLDVFQALGFEFALRALDTGEVRW